MFQETPRPRRRWLWLALMIVVVAGVTTAIVGAQQSRTRAVVNYLDVVHPETHEVERQASRFSDVANSIGTASRDELTADFGVMLRTLDEAIILNEQERFEGVEPAGALLEVSLRQWREGVFDFQKAVLAVADDPDSIAVATDEIAGALYKIANGETTYDLFLEADANLVAQVDVDIADPALIVWLTGPLPLSTRATNYATAASQASGLSTRARVVIAQISTEPKWVIRPTGAQVIPFTETLTINVVVANEGNRDSDVQPIEVAVLENETIVFEGEESVASLGPLQSTTVSFVDLPVVGGAEYVIRVSLTPTSSGIEGEGQTETVTFLVNEGT